MQNTKRRTRIEQNGDKAALEIPSLLLAFNVKNVRELSKSNRYGEGWLLPFGDVPLQFNDRVRLSMRWSASQTKLWLRFKTPEENDEKKALNEIKCNGRWNNKISFDKYKQLFLFGWGLKSDVSMVYEMMDNW